MSQTEKSLKIKKKYTTEGATLKCWLTHKHWLTPGENDCKSQFFEDRTENCTLDPRKPLSED